MNKLSEFKRQREIVRSHLDWLERQIAEAEGAPEPPESAPTAPETKPDSPTAPIAAATTANPTETQQETPVFLEFEEADGQRSAQETRAGCLLWTAVAIGLVLFLLFGLPYLLYR